MSTATLLILILLVVVLVSVMPTWGYSRSWGYMPSGVLGGILLVIILLFLLGML